MTRILVYAEPLPIRNRFDEFADAALLLGRALASPPAGRDLQLRVFGNDAVIDRITREDPRLATACLRPTRDERKAIGEQFDHWGPKSIAAWSDLVAGRGPLTDFYEAVLERLYRQHPFDVILLWGENGAVRRFVDRRGLLAVHAELGPTRSPFQPTLYFDPEGVNGNASLLRVPAEAMRVTDFDIDGWLAVPPKPGEVSPHDARVLLDPALAEHLPEGPFVLAPLQLADDLNLLVHSEFESPEDFLRQLAPVVLEAGYDIVVKPHPGAVHRPYNLVREDRALAFARRLGSRVKVLPRDLPATANAHLISHSSAVCAVNSSVVFEAAAMGKPAFSLGRAAFDIQGAFKADAAQLGGHLRSLSPPPRQREAVAFGLSRYFLARELITSDGALPAIIDFMFETRDRDRSAPAYWAEWGDRLARLGASQRGPDAEIFIGGQALRRPIQVKIGGRTVQMSGPGPEGRKITMTRTSGRFAGNVDECSVTADRLRIIGWSAAKDGDLPPAAVVVVAGGQVLAVGCAAEARPDVAAVLQQPMTQLYGYHFETDWTQEAGCPLQLLLVGDRGAVEVVDLAASL
ncbi:MULTISPECIES: hypothetical protein [unclassified Brevundimonas]|uniref:capsular polysaccharide export protein, LipB/KpsS family n=1 Tax=unclassified Brevundimonas TaxID=2622653 RepID=UPI0014318AE5|nr:MULTISPECIES: hypothetical protein [unclassified Brevundimonas]